MSAAPRMSLRRRDFLLGAGMLIGTTTLALPAVSSAAVRELPHLTGQDPQAQALHYTDDASRLDAGKNPTHTEGAKCANCQLYQGRSGEPFGPCQLYPGKAVSANGWCMGYQKKP